MKIKIGIAGLLTALLLGTGGPGGTPAAEAASGVSYCFRYANNLGGDAVTPHAYLQYGDFEHSVLEAYFSDGWRVVATGKTNDNGCGSFNIWGTLRNRYVRVSYIGKLGNAWYQGYSPGNALPGSAAPFLGSGIVYRVY